MKRKRKVPFGKITSDFSGFEESLNRMHDDKREYMARVEPGFLR
jgi:hypothetical protein